MEYSRINQNAVKSWLMGRCIFLVIFSIVYFIISIKFILPILGKYSFVKYIFLPLTIFIVIFLLVNTFVFPIIEYKEWRYKITEDKIELINGIFIKSKIIIPISRIQYLDVQQGPIYRNFRLACLSIHTAGSTHEIPALTLEEANQISTRLREIIEKSGSIE